MKKWNWSAAIFVMVLCALGVLSNKNIVDATGFFVLWLSFGIPFSLIVAYLGKED